MEATTIEPKLITFAHYIPSDNNEDTTFTLYSDFIGTNEPSQLLKRHISFNVRYEYPDYYATHGMYDKVKLFPVVLDGHLAFMSLLLTGAGDKVPIVYNEPENKRSIEKKAANMLELFCRVEFLISACGGVYDDVSFVGDFEIYALDSNNVELILRIYQIEATGETLVFCGTVDGTDRHTYYISNDDDAALEYVLGFWKLKKDQLIERNIVFLPQQYL
jgi:hypothetical protein